MDLDELEAYVIERLSAGVAQDDITLDIAHRGELSWPEAELLVRRTAALHEPTVARRQLPLLAVLAAAVIVGGLGVLITCALSLGDVWLLLKPGRSGFDRDRLTTLAALLAANAPTLSLILLGGVMILGGLIGLGRALSAAAPAD